MLKYVLPNKCNCLMISNNFNFLLTLKNRPIRWRTLYIERMERAGEQSIAYGCKDRVCYTRK